MPNLGLALGLAISAAGDVYVAVAAPDPTKYQAGIYKIPKAGGDATLFAKDAAMVFPNGIAFDSTGNLYVTDAIAGAVFKVSADGTTVDNWLTDALLKGDNAMTNPCSPHLPFTIGANGIAVIGTDLYVGNTDKASIIKIPIKGDGTADVPAPYVTSDATTCLPLKGLDGLFPDADGTILVAANGQNAVLRVDKTAKTTTIVDKGILQEPASVAPATLNGKKYLLLANFALNTAMSGGTPHPGLVSYGPLP
jgi:sugar lactone lactonase YvrE